MVKSTLDIAREAITQEQQAIGRLVQNLNPGFEQAIDAIIHCTGRVIISGIGKSAIIAQKIVSTFNSTGTPSLFMHAADAIHGDLGMIQENDIVIIISKSGESAEIKALVPMVRSLTKCLIAMVGNLQSFLASKSDIILDTTIDKEACPNNLAPTTSTTVQLVMGDALAVCLIELKKFSSSDFARLHPGGNLGKKLHLKVADLYPFNGKPQVKSEDPLSLAIIQMSKGRMGATAVLNEENQVIGIITDGDVRRLLEKTNQLSGVLAKNIMSVQPKTILPTSMATAALDLLTNNDLSQLIVADEQNIFLGFIHLHDLIKEGIHS